MIMSTLNKEEKPLKLVNLQDVYTLYANIGNNKLHLSPNIKFINLGGSWNIIQFICSWQRRHEKVSIILNNQVNIDGLNFCDEVLLVAFYLADEVLFQEIDIKKELLVKFIPFVENMNNHSLKDYFENIRARESKFLFLDRVRNEFLIFFYNKNKTFKSKEEIESLIENIFIKFKCHMESKQYNHNLNDTKTIIYEALSNTDRHGCRDISQTKIPKNIRALSIVFSSFNDGNREPFLKNQKHFKDFLDNVKDVVVISIFDSGEGIVKKYIETTGPKKIAEMNFEEKKDTLQKVFLAGVTSSKIPNSGMGLTYIKECIKKQKGLLAIRTNGLELFFTPTQQGDYQDHIGGIDDPCVGTLITVLIPLNFIGKRNV